MNSRSHVSPCVAIVGAGPAGLMAAEALAGRGVRVDVFDAMPSVGRKFLLAGKGGLNLTHSETFDLFVSRYGAQSTWVEHWLRECCPDDLREWAQGLGIGTFVGSSGRVFPTDMKSAPLLRAWLHRLRGAGVRFFMRHRWLGWGDDGGQMLRFATPHGEMQKQMDAVVLAVGGGSWPRLGSDGGWVPWLRQRGVEVAALRASNCGFDVARIVGGDAQSTGWTEHFASRYAGHPLKSVAVIFAGASGNLFRQVGEFVVTRTGVEGSLIYAASAFLRDEIDLNGCATLQLDLLPGRSLQWVVDELSHPRGSRSLATHLKSRLGLFGVKAGLLYELLAKADIADTARLAASIKALPLRLGATRPIEEAISSAGGVRSTSLDSGLMLRELKGVFCAGEMLDWEAPTGGYLLTACCASGRIAGQGVLNYLGLTPALKSAEVA